jgi:phytoene synthase
MDPVAEIVRRCDPDRYFCTLCAPPGARQALMTLYAFNHELARAAEVAREPALALIRLQWWREVVEGERRRHEVAGPLGALLDAGVLPAARLVSMIEARESGLEEEAPDPVALMHRGPGALAAAAGAVLGASPIEQQALVGLGAACGMAGVLRNAAVAPGRGGWRVSAERAMALEMLGPPARWRRAIVAAALPGVLARRDLARRRAVSARGLGDRLAVIRAAATCVI